MQHQAEVPPVEFGIEVGLLGSVQWSLSVSLYVCLGFVSVLYCSLFAGEMPRVSVVVFGCFCDVLSRLCIYDLVSIW